MSARRERRALAICGATSSGKSALAVRVARAVDGEIVNADSRQVYRDLPIGTGSPSASQLQSAPHHLFAFVDPCVRYSAGEYVRDAAAAIDDIVARGRVPIVTGGTGLYIEALAGTMPFDRPIADDALRERVRCEARTHPHAFLREWLETIDGAASARITPGDRYRTLRALEAALAARANPRRAMARAAPIDMTVAVIEVDRVSLAARIADRVQRMFDDGIVAEAIAVARRCAGAPALTGIGFAEAIAYHDGEATLAEAVRRTIARTVRYAKRQETWFAHMHGAVIVDATSLERATDRLVGLARETLAPA
ncbi:MAG TPA: tRNA (adenosine(37)-N6)-dimethylallyltransferase MiaA [Candidatus Eremiobacteraceae bacterium]|nr:tRNA (adenosine(37)-N6)-dimethylallyltransferase MiaA [Candidatus Eremiobacteraceae bacterium]